MEFIIKVVVDHDQVKGNENVIADALRFAVEGAMHQFKDGDGNRHAQTISYEVFVDWEI